MKDRARHPSFEEHGRSKLTLEDVKTIRQLSANGMATRAIARRYPIVNRTTITSVIKLKTWVTTKYQEARIARADRSARTSHHKQ